MLSAMHPFVLLLVGLAPVVALAFFYLRYIADDHGAGRWAWAWAALWVSGALQAAGGAPATTALANVCGAMFMAFLLAGAIEFRGGRPAAWLIPACLGFGLSRGALVLAGWPTLSYAIAAPYDVLLGVAAFREVRRAPYDSTSQASQRLLGPALLGLAALRLVDLSLRALESPVDWMVPVWVAGSFAAVLIQSVAVVDRLRLRERRAGEERERLAAVVEEEERSLKAVLDAAPVGIFLVDPDWRVTMANRLGGLQFGFGAPENWLGRPAPEIVGKHLERLVDPEGFMTALRSLARDPRAVLSLEVRFRAPDERVLWMHASPVLSEDGSLLGRVFTSRDVSDERRLEEELRQAQKMETLGTLAGGIAHDFNNQLTAILGNCRFVEGVLPDGHEARPALADLAGAAEHCADLTRGLLAFARRAPSEPRASDVEEVARAVERVLRATLPSRVRCTLEAEPGLSPALVDPTQLQQILLNLCVNARDAIPGEGTIQLSIRNREVSDSEARELGAEACEHVEICVRDDGVGMDAATRARAFDPFFTTKPLGAGTGLGLAVVYGLVRSHGGTIGIESEPGRGTTIRVLLPVASALPAPSPRGPAEPGGARGELVLLAEDEPAVRRVAAGALRRAGYRVLEAADGAEAVARARGGPGPLNLAILDLAMPRLDGLRTLEALRGQQPGLPVLLISGHFPAELAAPAGVQLLAKPFEPEELTARVRALLDYR
jgi:PAS domain S-box-containing protein